jgi:hypothetical protein
MHLSHHNINYKCSTYSFIKICHKTQKFYKIINPIRPLSEVTLNIKAQKTKAVPVLNPAPRNEDVFIA